MCWDKELWPKWKKQIKTPEKELNDKEVANLSDAEFKTLVIRILTELVEFGHKIKEEVKAMKSETKENVQGTNSDRKKTGTQINGLKQKKETFNESRMKQQEFKEMRRGLGTFRTTLNVQISES